MKKPTKKSPPAKKPPPTKKLPAKKPELAKKSELAKKPELAKTKRPSKKPQKPSTSTTNQSKAQAPTKQPRRRARSGRSPTLNIAAAKVDASSLSAARLITENHLDDFARTNANVAQGVIVELVFRLVAASVAKPKERRFPLGDSINQPGPDGALNTNVGFPPFIPDGRSFWEIGAGLDARTKANSDYKDLTKSTPATVRSQAAFVFVTPHSGRRDFPHTWKKDDQLAWLETKRGKKKWKHVEILDATKLVDWLMHFPAVERWLAAKLGITVSHTTTPDLYWQDLRLTGDPPPLSPDVFLVGRDDARKRLEQVFAMSSAQLRIDTHKPQQVLDFVAAHIAALPDDDRLEIAGRCLFVLEEEAWEGVIELSERHVLVVGFDLQESEHDATTRLQNAKNRNHLVVYGAPPGGAPHPNRAALPSPRPHQLQSALQTGGHSPERARMLAEKSGGDLASLVRLLHNASLHPEWATKTDAAEILIADFHRSWDENNPHDKSVVESLAGKTYGEWIGRVREMASRRDTPLSYRHGVWRVAPRYEVWSALAPHVYDELLDRFRGVAVQVLGETNPALELAKGERYLAPVKGMVLKHSTKLRHGIAETTAMLGAMASTLVACTPGRATGTAALAIRQVLTSRDWRTWASLDQLLPMLAEADPDAFLSALEAALLANPSPIDELFAEEDSGFGGQSYVSGILWALETLAWEPTLLVRVTLALGQMAAKDPGGRWANRPMTSLTTVYLPWLPQTTATLERKRSALQTLAKELPDQAWKLLLALLPKGQGFSTGSRRPSWRDWIPLDHVDETSHEAYWQQVSAYTEISLELALSDDHRLKELLSHLDELPSEARDKVIDYLTEHGRELPEPLRNELWTALEDLIGEHRRFTDAHWAFDVEVLDRLAAVAAQLKPTSILVSYQRLFTEKDFDLFDENDDYAAQSKRLAERRTRAAREIYVEHGLDAVLELAHAVESPSRLGYALGSAGIDELDARVVPSLISSEDAKTLQFVAGFVRARFFAREAWLGHLSLREWPRDHVVKLLTWLPFTALVWKQAEATLGAAVDEYWRVTPANVYEAGPDLTEGIRELLDRGRPIAALRGLYVILMSEKDVDVEQTVRALLNAAKAPEPGRPPDAHTLARLIEHIQSKAPKHKELLTIEWLYLGLLDKHFAPGPLALEAELSANPIFFCEVLRLVFKSEHMRDQERPEPTEQERKLAMRAYQLLGEWHRMPGLHGTEIREQELNSWLEAVLEQCEQSGHSAIAQSYIGRVFAHSPRVAGQAWPVDAVARVLNELSNESMRRGFTMELFNMRGVHAWDGGKSERVLAEKFREHADALEKRGYARLAIAIRRLGDRYVVDSEREASKDYE